MRLQRVTLYENRRIRIRFTPFALIYTLKRSFDKERGNKLKTYQKKKLVLEANGIEILFAVSQSDRELI